MSGFCRGEFNCSRTWLVEGSANCAEEKSTDVGMWMMENVWEFEEQDRLGLRGHLERCSGRKGVA